MYSNIIIMNISVAQLVTQPPIIVLVWIETVSLSENNQFDLGQLSHWNGFPPIHCTLSELKVME